MMRDRLSPTAEGATIGRTLSESSPSFHVPLRAPSGAPNVVVILLDDLGFADLGCFGSRIETPNIDGLASDGLQFNRFHVPAMCSPTRACLLTGRNHHAVGMGWLANVPLAFPGYNARIPPTAGTLPRILRDAGYSTFAVGKWHLAPGYETTAAGPFNRWPSGQGFEQFYGFLHGETNQWTPELVRDNRPIDPPAGPGERYHLTEDLADQAIRYIQDQQQAAPGKPFFLYFCPGAMHFPHHVPRVFADRYAGMFDGGWEELREDVFRRQKELRVIPDGCRLTERPPWIAPWRDLPSDERRLYAAQMEVYAGFLSHTDAQIGRLVDFLRRTGALDNTLILVMADNGASAEGGPLGWTNRVGFGRPEGDGSDLQARIDRLPELGGPRTFDHYSWGWAWASNTPFRMWKRYSWLGGTRVPFVVHHPAVIPQGERGSVRGQFAHAIDVLPTILELAGVDAPGEIDGLEQLPLHGRSLASALADGEAPSPRSTQYFEVRASRAIYHDGWKATTDHVDEIEAERLLIPGSRTLEDDVWSLFQLDDDFSESKDVAADHPDVLRALVDLWRDEAERNGVFPVMDGLFEDLAGRTDRGRWEAASGYVFWPEGGPIATPTLAEGFCLVAELEFDRDRAATGIVCAQGNWHCGWALYAAGSEFTAEFAFARETWRITAASPTDRGKHTVELTFAPSGGTCMVRLSIDRGPGEELRFEADPGQVAFLGRGLLRVGRDDGFPVSDAYAPPFAFDESVVRVRFRPGRPPTMPVAEIEQELRDE